MAESITKEEKFVKRLDFSSANVASSWQLFKSQFNIYKVAKKFTAMSEIEQICNMLVQMGPDSVQIYDQFVFDEAVAAKKCTLKNTLKLFDDYFEPVKNVIFERAKFNSMKQGDLSIHQFIVNLQRQADYCDYAGVKGELIRDRVIVGVRDQKLREYLIDIEDLDLPKCILKAKQYTSNHGQATQFSVSDDNVDAVGSYRPPRAAGGSKRFESSYKKPVNPSMSPVSPVSPVLSSPCFWCGKQFHRGKSCPAKESSCRLCQVKGHWARSQACKKRQGGAAAHEVDSYIEDDMEGLFLDQ